MFNSKLLLFSPETGPRLRYIATHLAVEMLGAELLFTGNPDEARSADLPLINYSSFHIPQAVNIIPDGLLEESGIKPQIIEPEIRNGTTVFFPSAGTDDTGFDLFAASFYMLSRYEEYLPFIKDDHGRFPFTGSIAFKYSLAEEPLVDLWAMKLKESIIRKYPAVSFPEREFSFIPTIDVDIPWAYRNRRLWRTAGGVVRSLLKTDMDDLSRRYGVLYKGDSDPYDTFGFIEKLHNSYGLSPMFFFSAGTYGKFDKSVSPRNPEYGRLMGNISKKYKWGIHPSYRSADDPALLRKEIEMIRAVTGRAPFRSRQHYLRFGLPETCRRLIANGIKEDYTMGWAEMPGFRAGTCTPFIFYDLEREEPGNLKIFPLQIMDGTLRDYVQLNPEQAAERSLKIVEKIRGAGGTLVTLWHNESFSGYGRWKDWEKVYPEILKAAI